MSRETAKVVSRHPIPCQFATSTSAVIPQLTRVFTMYRIPEEVKIDNGPRLMGANLQNVPNNKGSGIELKSHWGGRRQMGTSNVSCRQSRRGREIEGKAFKKEVQRTVGNYRATPHPVTRESPRQASVRHRDKMKNFRKGSSPKKEKTP